MERIPEGEAIPRIEQAREFNRQMGRGSMRREYRELAVTAIKMGIPAGGRVVDIGTGPGFVALELADQLRGHAQVIGLDLSPAMLIVAAENATARGLQDWVSWQEGDAADMPFGDGEVDFIVSAGSLHHWADPLVVFDEFARILKPAGQCLIQDLKRDMRGLSFVCSRLIGLTIPTAFRVHYYNSIRSAYTVNEVRVLLHRSRLTRCAVEEDLMGLRIVKRAGETSGTG